MLLVRSSSTCITTSSTGTTSTVAVDSRDQGKDRDTNVWLFRRWFVKHSVDRKQDKTTVRGGERGKGRK